jgi:hypothetical protein
MFAPELESGSVVSVLDDWSLPDVDLWAVFPSGRQASAKARSFTGFIERQLAGATDTPISSPIVQGGDGVIRVVHGDGRCIGRDNR